MAHAHVRIAARRNIFLFVALNPDHGDLDGLRGIVRRPILDYAPEDRELGLPEHVAKPREYSWRCRHPDSLVARSPALTRRTRASTRLAAPRMCAVRARAKPGLEHLDLERHVRPVGHDQGGALHHHESDTGILFGPALREIGNGLQAGLLVADRAISLH